MKDRLVMRRKMKDTAFKTNPLHERSILLMTYDTASEPAAAAGPPLTDTREHLLVSLPVEAAPSSRSRGRPVSLSAWHLSLAVLLCLLRGLQSQLEVWRLIAFYGVGCLPALPLSDQAVYDPLEQDGVSAFQSVFAQLSQGLAHALASYYDTHFAPSST